MRSARAVFRRDLAASLESPAAPVTAILFVVALHGLFLFLGYPIGASALPGLFEGGVASLQTLFTWIPSLFVLVVPALTMGAWAEERREGTDELLLTLPLRVPGIVLGKFLALWVLLGAVLLAAVLPMAGLVSVLGPLDWGTVTGGCIGAWAMGAAFLGIGMLASALTDDQLVAFLLGAIALGALWSLALFVRVLPAELAELAYDLSPHLHFVESGARGVLDLRDFLHHALVASVALFLCGVAIERRRFG